MKVIVQWMLLLSMVWCARFLAIPMVGLYFLAAAIASLHDARKAKKQAATGVPRASDVAPAETTLPPAEPVT
jgi:Sec-independent protein secretion pathway component TatC